MSNYDHKTTPGGRPDESGNPSLSSDSAGVHSYSGGTPTCFVDFDAHSRLLGEEGTTNTIAHVTPDVTTNRPPVEVRRWYARGRNWAWMIFSTISIMCFIAQTAVYVTSVDSAVNSIEGTIDVRLQDIKNDTFHLTQEVHILCRIITSHPDCHEMMARKHNKTMHTLNGNMQSQKTNVSRKDDPNPPADPQLSGNEMKVKVNTVGPIPFPFNNEAAKRVQALIAHPLLEAASNNLGILNNHVRPSRHGIVSSYRSTTWNTFNISSRSYVGLFYKLVPDTVDENAVVVNPEPEDRSLMTLLKKDIDFVVEYDNEGQVLREFGPDMAEKFASGKYAVTAHGKLVMKRKASSMRSFKPNAVRKAKAKLEKEEREAPASADSEISSVEFLATSTMLTDITGEEEVQEPVQTEWPIYADVLPARVITVSSTNYETMAKPTFTPLKIAIDEINADKMGAGLSMNLVRGWNQTDINSLNLMVNKISKSSDSFFEEAALVRCGCILNSIVPDAYSIDPTTRRFIRRTKPTWGQTEVHVAKNKTFEKGFKFLVTTTDVAGVYLRSKTFPATLGAPFKASTLDKEWTIIPIDPAKYSGKSIVAYITSFLDSSLWEGSVNYTVDVTAIDQDSKDVKTRYVLMPTCNSVRIPGKKNFMLVLANSVGMNAPDSITIGNTRCMVWRNYHAEPIIYDFAPIWYMYFSSNTTPEQFEDLAMHFVRAWNVISDTLATMDSVGRAASVIAEVSSNYTYGICRTNWAEGGAATGAWTIGGGALHPTLAHITTQDMYKDCLGVENSRARQRMVGYNFGYHSAWMSFPQSVALAASNRLDDKLNPDRCEIYWTQVVTANPQYHIKEATSFFRLCLVFGLVETTHQTVPIMTPQGFQNWVNSHAILMAMSVVDFINQSAIPPTSWFIASEMYDALTMTTMMNANESLTLGLAKPNRLEEMLEDSLNWDWDKIQDYYGFPPTDNEYDAMLPFNSSSVLQWLEKTDQTVPHTTLPTAVVKWITAGAATNHRVIVLHKTDRISSLYAGSTPDMMFTNYEVRVDWSCLDTTRFAYIWCEQPELETATDGEFKNMLVETGKLVPQAFVLSNLAWPTQLNEVQRSWIIRSLSDDNSDMPPQSVSKLILPDPIDWKSFLEGIRDWVIYPAAHGGLGYLAGGVPGAMVGAGASLLSKIQKESSGATKETIAPISTVANQIHGAMLSEAQKTGATLKPAEIASIAKTEVLKGPTEASPGDTSAQQQT